MLITLTPVNTINTTTNGPYGSSQGQMDSLTAAIFGIEGFILFCLAERRKRIKPFELEMNCHMKLTKYPCIGKEGMQYEDQSYRS
jgi:hypothetical protein